MLGLRWTPDGSLIVFSDRDVLETISSEGGGALTVVADTNTRDNSMYGMDADISPEGDRVAHTSCDYPTQAGERWDHMRELFPNWLDDLTSYNYEIVVSDIDGGDSRRLTEDLVMDRHPTWSHGGDRIAFVGQVPFCEPTCPRYEERNPDDGNLYTISPDGSDLRDMTPTFPKSTEPRTRATLDASPKWSPDDRYIAFRAVDLDEGVQGGAYLLYTVEIETLALRRFPRENVWGEPAWSPDGQRIAFWVWVESPSSGSTEWILYTALPDGSGVREVFRKPNYSLTPVMEWSPDGSEIMFFNWTGLFVVGHDGSAPRNLHTLEAGRYFSGWSARWSPDGSRIAVLVDDGSRLELFTIAPDGSDRLLLLYR